MLCIVRFLGDAQDDRKMKIKTLSALIQGGNGASYHLCGFIRMGNLGLGADYADFTDKLYITRSTTPLII